MEKKLALADLEKDFSRQIADVKDEAAKNIAAVKDEAAKQIIEALNATMKISNARIEAANQIIEALNATMKTSNARIEAAKGKSDAKIEQKSDPDAIAAVKIQAANDVNERDIRIALLENNIKYATVDLLLAKEMVSISAAVESIAIVRGHTIYGGIQSKINALYKKNPAFRQNYDDLCGKLNCANNNDEVPGTIYHALSTNVHGGGYPLRCNTKNKALSQAQWAFVLAMFKTYLPANAFVSHDSNDEPMDFGDI